MSNIIPFLFRHHEKSHEVRAVVIDDEDHFVGKDTCDALGYADHTNAMKQHCRGVVKHHPIPDSLGRMRDTRVLTEADVLRLIVNSKLPSAEAFERWVFEEVLPSIRKTGGYQMSSAPRSSPKLEAEMAGAELYARLLRPAPSSQVAMIAQIVANNGGDPKFLPAYTIDAAPDQLGASSMPTKPLRELLNDHGGKMSAQAFNKLLVEAGYLEERTRPSSTARDGVKSFKAITDAGMRFGKNLTSPSNPRETQPHWYVERFAELYDLVAVVEA
ncbi:Bro-N domain-containing protein [Paraburkholderia tropica]|uniref:BRO-N domain-containing protein n=1 Tax=Paraburkholderia tropica TaxID=92647 RepID=UPI0030164433